MRLAVLKRRPRVLSGRRGKSPAHAGIAGAADHQAHMRNAGAGWYFDPDDVAVYRFWDGHSWTDQRTDILPSNNPAS